MADTKSGERALGALGAAAVAEEAAPGRTPAGLPFASGPFAWLTENYKCHFYFSPIIFMFQ